MMEPTEDVPASQLIEGNNIDERFAEDGVEGDCGRDEYSEIKEELFTYIQESEQSLATKTELLHRNNNAALNRPDVVEICKRDHSVKKNSGFIKKLRNLGVAQIDLMIKECQSINLSKYLSEAAAAIVEAKIKFTDIPSAVLLCTELNSTYAEFSCFLHEEFIKVLNVNRDEPLANANRLRVELCFYAELSVCGVIPARKSLPVLGTTLTALTADKAFNTLSLILTFCKHCGSDYAGLVPRRIRLLADQFNESIKVSNLLVSSKQENVRKLLQDYYVSLCQHLTIRQEKLSFYERQSRQILTAKGELHPDRISNAEVMRTEIQSLLSGAVTLAELLDVELPDLPDFDLQDLQLDDGEDCSGGHVWEDEEMRLFYTELPNIKEFITQLNRQEEGQVKDVKKIPDVIKPVEAETNKKSALEAFLKSLPECKSKAAIDNAALEFMLYFNYKTGRKKLNIALFTIPRRKLELMPFYARFVAILSPVIPEVGTTLCQQLKSEMLRHIHKKDQDKLESKKKTMKFIGELVNFGVFTKKEVLRALKLLLYDFSHHNIDMVCSLLETCGGVLYAASDTHISTKYYLEQMMRLKTMMALDARYVTLVENTYYQILPPETTSLSTPNPLTPMQQFIHKIISENLMQPGSDVSVLNLLRSLNWDDREIFSYAVMCLTDATNIGYLRIRALANVVSMLADYQEDSVCWIVDGVLEDIRLGMELNEFSINQRRVSMIKYLGELYNYRVLDSTDILRILYSLISFGVALEQNTVSYLDPPTSVMRIHLVLLLLDTCAFPVTNQEVTKKLEYFFIYFQRYYLMKMNSLVWTEEQPFPKDIVYRFEDVITYFCPEMKLALNFDEADNAVISLNNKMFADVSLSNPDSESRLGTVFEDEQFSDEDEDTKEDENLKEGQSTLKTEANKRDEADEEFTQELSKLISESTKEAEALKTKPKSDIAVPLNYKKKISEDQPQFVVMLKKGNKQTFKALELPLDHEFFVELKSREEACKKEKEKVKRLTLDINERLQEDT